jgi:hypothetical protein
MNNYKTLVNALLAKSNSTNITDATKEWKVTSYDEYRCNCVCGKENIVHNFTIYNIENGNILGPIGNRCVNHFNITDAEKRMKILTKKNTIFKNPGKAYDGKTYEEVCKDHKYITFIRNNSKKSTYKKLIEYIPKTKLKS